MAIAKPTPLTALLNYEAYMAEGTVEGRYDIIDGVRVFMPAPTWEHQGILGNIYARMRDHAARTGSGKALMAPFDILITRRPRLRTRQPDVLFISNERLAQAGGPPKKGPLEVAPELVVEIISDTERQREIDAKIADYISIGMKECWRVGPDARMVEVLRLTDSGAEVVAVYHEGETPQSLTFSDLTLAVADIFAA